MKNGGQDSAERRRAQQLWDRKKRREDVVLTEREKQHQADMAKMAHLKALRLAKEAADKAAAPPKPARGRKTPA